MNLQGYLYDFPNTKFSYMAHLLDPKKIDT